MLDLARDTARGLFVLHYLAAKDRPVGAARIARDGQIPPGALAPVLRKLRSAGLVAARRGRGLALGRQAAEITVGEVVKVLEDGGPPPKVCAERFDSCAYRESCPLSPLCREAHERARSAMRDFTLADLRLGPVAVADCATRRRVAT